MRLIAWTACHSLAMIGFHALLGSIDEENLKLGLFGMPVVLGAVQLAFLARELPKWGLLWLPASLLGLFLSFLGCWWFLVVLGAGMGVAQTPILAAAGYRGWWLWAPASAIGWFVGMVVASRIMDGMIPSDSTESIRMAALYGITAFSYGLSTAGALRFMPRSSREPDCSQPPQV